MFLRKVIIESILYPLKFFLSIILLLILNTGCSQQPLSVEKLSSLLLSTSSKADFQLVVTRSDTRGKYKVEGSTNFPDESRIAVAAIRYLRAGNELSVNPNPKSTYSILAYKDVKINQGKLQTELNLWKVAPDGKFQEAWQLDQPQLNLSLVPANEVTFLATFAPSISLTKLEQQLKKQGKKLTSDLVKYTTDGQSYVQASRVLSVPLPTGETTPPQKRAEDINGGWGPRYLLLPEPENINKLERPGQRRTSAPLSTAEFLQ